MTKERNEVWRFFASVKLALWVISLLAATSILGTVIPQSKPGQYYVEEYGAGLARLLQTLDIVPNMYGSWWFITLLIIFAINLIVCSLDRLPNAWRIARQDNLESGPDRLAKMPLKAEMTVAADPGPAAERLGELLAAAGWKAESRVKEGGILLFAQKGPWSRLGAYLIHLSILLIFAGALTGAVLGYKGGIMFPEGETVNYVFDRSTDQPVPLDFEIYLDQFEITYYPDGTTREFRSDVIINDPETGPPWRTSILVNHPLKHRGLTFYQASYRALDQFLVHLRNPLTGEERYLLTETGRQYAWPEENVTFEVLGTRSDQSRRAHEYRIQFASPGAEPSVFAMVDRQTVTIERPEKQYSFYIQQRYSTGLQVARDPGVWIVYLGFALMCLGLYVTFMITHRRIWAYLTPDGQGRARLLLCGGSNRNKAVFDQRFAELAERLRRDQAIN